MFPEEIPICPFLKVLTLHNLSWYTCIISSDIGARSLQELRFGLELRGYFRTVQDCVCEGIVGYLSAFECFYQSNQHIPKIALRIYKRCLIGGFTRDAFEKEIWEWIKKDPRVVIQWAKKGEE